MRGVPTIMVVSEAFTGLAKSIAHIKGYEHVPTLVLPHPPTRLSDSKLEALATDLAALAAQLLGHGTHVDHSEIAQTDQA